MSEPRPWHRLFGLAWTDFCEGSPMDVQPEVDMSVQQQFADLMLIRQGSGPLPQPLPDGFDNLSRYNLVTFKSHQEALDFWTLCELIAHYVSARKRCSSSPKNLLPESDFRLYAVCVRYPHNLAQELPLTLLQEGVYEVLLGLLRIRVIVVQQLPQAEQNALLHLFSTRVEQVQYAREHYKPRTTQMTTLFYDLLKMESEDPAMSEALKKYARERLPELLKEDPTMSEAIEERAREVLKKLPLEERLDGLSPEELRAALEILQRRLQTNGSSPESP